ncbi:protein of unknown function [Pseudomonas sp. JV551A1]|uniref:Uncharacterized protein n=1 Tax=Pseudomonas inefficax TaxID=2078786 RepID=A0AAQ1STG3_9PSED|nr:protein of unknown function [Pseudomonas sp. JV551A1]SPO60881.1 protein of unknown function [Pseudomonas inefficax]
MPGVLSAERVGSCYPSSGLHGACEAVMTGLARSCTQVLTCRPLAEFAGPGERLAELEQSSNRVAIEGR